MADVMVISRFGIAVETCLRGTKTKPSLSIKCVAHRKQTLLENQDPKSFLSYA